MLQYRGNSKKGGHVEITRRKKNIMRRVTIADKVDEIFVASSKAKNDVRQIFLDYGYQSIAIFRCKTCNGYFRYGFDVSDGVKTRHIENAC